MELYINPDWTERYANTYIGEAIAWSENGNHATICAVAATAAEADVKLMEALRELRLTPEASIKEEQ